MRWLPTLFGAVVLAGCSPQKQDAGPAAAAALVMEAVNHLVQLPTGTLRLPKAEWKPLANEYEWAENFEQLQLGPRHEFPRVVTVYKLPRTEDRKVGVQISPKEWVAMFVAHPGTVTAEIRMDKGSYWGMSRETFTAKSVYGVDTSDYGTFYDERFTRAREAFQSDIDTTRYLLDSRF